MKCETKISIIAEHELTDSSWRSVRLFTNVNEAKKWHEINPTTRLRAIKNRTPEWFQAIDEEIVQLQCLEQMDYDRKKINEITDYRN